MKKTPAYIAAHIRRVLKDGASAPHTEEVQRFFKEEIQSRGWYTDELRKVAVRFRRAILNDYDRQFLIEVADRLFRGRVLEEKVFGVVLLESESQNFGDAEFRRFESWLDRISTWADHDALLHYVIGPMVLEAPKRATAVFRWAKSADRWHRRAAAVALIRSARQKKLFAETEKITKLLLDDDDDMVQKGLGWLLRESAKCNREQTLPLLMKIRERAPRLVLRTACEKLPLSDQMRVLGKARKRSAAASARG